MRIIIVEDEALAAERLVDMLQDVKSNLTIIGVFDCIEETLEFLNNNPDPDLAFFDIQIADGLSFSIFEQYEVRFPVVFTTAYDQYALKAFEVNSIDYLLKPIEPALLDRSFQKYENLKGVPNQVIDLDVLQQTMAMMKKPAYKNRFLVKSGVHLNAVETNEIAYFWSASKMTWLRKNEGKKHTIDYSLEQLENILDPSLFFRVNRKYLIHLKAIEKATVYSNSRLKLQLPNLDIKEEVIVSREKIQKFKNWFEGS